MPRHLYSTDLLVRDGGAAGLIVGADAPFTLWSDRVGGTQYTDCVAPDGVTPVPRDGAGAFRSDGSGQLPEMRGPNDVTAMFIDTGTGARYAWLSPSAFATAVNAVLGWLTNGLPGGSGGGGVSDHGALSGLSDDDHPLYLNVARGDARYPTITAMTSAINTAGATASAADRARANHTGTQAIGSVEGLEAALVARPITVSITSSGSTEGRPAFSGVVLWVGGTVEPVNRLPQDVWLGITASGGGGGGGSTGSGLRTPVATTAPAYTTGTSSFATDPARTTL